MADPAAVFNETKEQVRI